MLPLFEPISDRQTKILSVLRQSPDSASSKITDALGSEVAAITVKRDLAALVRSGYIALRGAGRGVTYRLTPAGALFTPVDAHSFAGEEPDRRSALTRYDFELFPGMPATLFSPAELAALRAATERFTSRAATLTATIARRELERFVIELSWKSSRIEGNTYTLLDTERLIRDGIEAEGRPHDDAVMILNHKKAFEFVLAHRADFIRPTRAVVEEVHRLLTDGLGVPAALRSRMVGITGSAYLPLDNEHQIREALDALIAAVGRFTDPYSAALILLAGLSYVQPFEDGNKRTARLIANAMLVANGLAPLSYRSTDEIAYREAMLVFYELHSIIPIKRIFTEQYLFASDQYGLRL
jgi:fido (protein-threonine AMPylation protein)